VSTKITLLPTEVSSTGLHNAETLFRFSSQRHALCVIYAGVATTMTTQSSDNDRVYTYA